MGRKHRRDFLKLCAASVPALVLANGAAGLMKQRTAALLNRAYRTPVSLERYIDPLPLSEAL